MIRRTRRTIRAFSLVLILAVVSAVYTPLAPATQPMPVGIATNGSGYSYGSGAYYVATRRKVLSNWGNAKTWYAYAQGDGYGVGDTPKKGAIAWTDRGPYGQVTIVEDVSADGAQVTISEMNGEGNSWNRVTTRTAPASSFKYIY